MDDTETLQYLKKQEKSRLLTSIIIKVILSAIAGIALLKTMPLNFTNTLAALLIFAFVYDVCCIYQFSLKLTHNYIIAVLVSVAILGGCFFLYNAVLGKLGWLDKQYSGIMEYLLTIIVILLLLIPLMLNVRSVINLSKKD